MPDVYLTQEYGKLYENIEKGELVRFQFRCAYGEVLYQYLKRPIQWRVDGVEYFDTMTPYGYGGPCIVEVREGKTEALLNLFEKALNAHCREQRIVAEFVRFHPVLRNAEVFRGIYELFNVRESAATRLDCSENPAVSELTKTAKRGVNKAVKFGLNVRITENPPPEIAGIFYRDYCEHMDRLNAEAHYRFNEEYFKELLISLNNKVILAETLLGDEVLGRDIELLGENAVYCHLGSMSVKGTSCYGNYLLNAELIRWAKERGYRYVVYGSGRTSAPDDSLLLFKKHFSKHTSLEYWQGKRISQPEIYDQLVKLSGKTDNGDYFPSYRS
ncbi:MAG TPA: GNAT family N-acetyltransferase [Oscillospiraceae bacterium]|nr:GNAT family N-acetyltransferase [Oscillospiraceae bacterium]HPF55250.1 GNAT family N-acetyltransferase [Clostridiales bacterium]HPK36024.1 GNAT family N-acetyltransferase [Oscillospiraceae bacterium]HPR76319.1 GNAT family N-acetyltransferase [Oscillospiraceae bacterium]